MKYIKYVFVTIILICFFYLAAGQLLLPRETPNGTYNCQELTADWTWVKSDGSRVPVTIPGNYPVARNEIMTIETTLPEDLGSNIKCLQFLSSRQDMKIFVDDRLRQQYSTADSRLFGKTSSMAYVILELNPTDAGKKLTVTFQSDSSYSGVLRTVYCGDKMSMWTKMFRDYGAELIVAFILLILGIAASIVSMVLRHIYHRQINLEYLGWGIAIVAAWLIFNSVFRQLLFPNLSTASDVTFLAVTLIPLPFLFFLNSVQNGRYEKWFTIMAAIVITDCLICAFLHTANLVDYSSSIMVVLAVCLCSFAFIGFTIICDIRNGYTHEYRLILVGICIALLFATTQIILYYFRIETTFNGVLVAAGLIILLFLAALNTIIEVFRLEQEKKEAILANQAKAVFLASMSHEIRTPLNAVLGMDELILRESTEKNIQEYALDIKNAGRSLLALINDILDFSKIESGKLTILPSEYEVVSLLNDCYSMTSGKAEAKKLTLQVDSNPLIPKILYGDEIRIRQIILNLLNNAIKYTSEGEVILSLDGHSLGDNEYLLQITISDTGIGIRAEDQPKLFESFERIDEIKNRNIEGTGLGLPITKQLVDLMHGTITVKSEYGSGSVFRVELPQKIVSAEAAGDFISDSPHNTSGMPSHQKTFRVPEGRILIVDDVPLNLKFLKALLKPSQIQIDTARSGMECLELVKTSSYHIIFLDHMMPDMDGVETLRAMHKLSENKNTHTPVIMLTANALSGAREEYLAAGFSDYLAKPVQPDKLQHILLKYLPQELFTLPAGSQSDFPVNSDAPGTVSAEEAVSTPSDASVFPDNIDFLDTDTGIAYCNNDPAVYRMVLNAYASAPSCANLEKSFQEEDWKRYGIEIHGIKSSSLTIGAASLSERAKALEFAVKENNIAYVREQHTAFVADYQKLIGQIKASL